MGTKLKVPQKMYNIPMNPSGSLFCFINEDTKAHKAVFSEDGGRILPVGFSYILAFMLVAPCTKEFHVCLQNKPLLYFCNYEVCH